MKREAAAIAAAILLAAANAASAQRIHRSIDDGWRFLRGDASRAEAADYDDRAWRTVDLPHDYSIDDLPPAPARRAQVVLDAQGWRMHAGDDPAWSGRDIDESGWKPVAPAALNTLPENSYAWLRRRFAVPPGLRGKDVQIVLGKVDDVDVTYVNGVQVGASGSVPPAYATAWDVTRRYAVPAKLLKGDGSDVVAVRVYNGGGAGGITPPGPLSGISRGPFDSDAPGGGAEAYTVGGPGWYRKSLTVPRAWAGRKVAVDIDGAYQDATVWLNGRKIGAHADGYTSFELDLTPYLAFGGRNVLAVRVDTSGHHSRWYSGSGLYRHVWLTVTEPLRFAHWGVSVTTPKADPAAATVAIRARILDDLPGAVTGATARFRVRDAAGRTVAETARPIDGAAKDQQQEVAITVRKPALWSPERANLYTLESEISAGGRVVDDMRTSFGIRSISFDPVRGFLLNGRPTKLRGGCVHHDNGPLGSAAYDRAEERRVELLKAAGFNAIRTSHNPPSPAFLDACDRLGMIVIDEAFDCWAQGKAPMDYARFFAANWQSDLRSMVERDRNHPCVALWSIGNEIPEQESAEGVRRARELAGLVRDIDPTRPVTAAYSGGDSPYRNDYLASLDVAGYNYKRGDYERDHAAFPSRVFVATESVPKEALDFWMPVERHPYVVGDFVWTALDYLGEAGIGRAYYPGEPTGFLGEFPWTVSGCGDLDLIGSRKPQSYYRGIVWKTGPKVAAFVDAAAEGTPESAVTYWGWPDERASWTWPGSEGKKRTVRVYARTPKVKLIVNGRDLGEKETTSETRYTAAYAVPYEPGEIDAVGLDEKGREVARWTLKTAGVPCRLRLTPDRKTIHADGQDLSYVTVELLDKDGSLCTNASDRVTFTLKGPGTLIALGNGQPDSIESFHRPERSAFEGRLLAIVKSSHNAGTITLTAVLRGAPAAGVDISSAIVK